MGSWYDTAEICKNGHVITNMAGSSPQFRKKFCDKCGAGTITQCQECATEIQGYYHVEGVLSFSDDYVAPAFCFNCGKPYPWTEVSLQAAKDLAQELDELSADERKILVASLDDLIRETPKTMLATTRFKKIVAKVGLEAAQGFKSILINIVSEAAKKSIWP